MLFTDIVGSTEQAGQLGDRAWRGLLQRFHALCRVQIEGFRGREIDTADDGCFAIFGGPARAMRCADAMVRGLQALGITIRAGLHTGEVKTQVARSGPRSGSMGSASCSSSHAVA
jgi:class 3 adenylate cyclase